MNILLTCAGRRNYLIEYFKSALGDRGQVIACDSSASAPALMEADWSFVVPAMDRPDYLDVLAAICAEQQVGLLIPVHDLELPGLAAQATRFREIGTIPVIASPRTIAMCQDKWATFNFLKACDIPTPQTCRSLGATREALAKGDLRYPLLIKPRWGVSSIGVELIENERELTLAHEWGQVQLKRSPLAKLAQDSVDQCFVFQQWLSGAEYGMDVVNDLDGQYVTTLARRKLVMRAGNTDRAVSVAEPRLEYLGKVLGQRLGHLGSLDCDVIAADNGFMVLDLNPRLGGGYPFSHLAGANLPAALIAWANGEQPEPAWLTARRDVTSARYDGITRIDETAPSTQDIRELQVG